ncbi:MAG: hypothetical protein JST16_01065 [Bdellovibrionales bacterium]|nr:hypothetical protein [Bdellovibrionales bacterium]
MILRHGELPPSTDLSLVLAELHNGLIFAELAAHAVDADGRERNRSLAEQCYRAVAEYLSHQQPTRQLKQIRAKAKNLKNALQKG